MKSIVLGALLLATNFASAGYVNVDQLNQKLQKTHAGWTAKETWVNQQSKTEIQHMMGLRRDSRADVQFHAPESMRVQQSLPPKMDWRDHNGQNWVSPMLNQANCGSCVAFAAIGVLETQVNISSLISNLNRRFSPQYLFACGGGMCNWGWMPDSAASFLQRNGAPDEACLPYSSGATGKDVACSAACSDSRSRIQKIADYSTPSRSAENREAVKEALLHGPVMTTLSVYADFMTYAGGVYKRTSNEYMGGHAVSIVGYDDESQSWIIRNSWGEDWGEKGFAHIAYSDDSGISDETWGFDVPALDGYVSTLFPRDYDYIAGHADFKGSSTFASTAQLKFRLIDGVSRNEVMNQTCTSQSACSASIDTTGLKDGRYEVETIAVDGTGKDLSHSTRQFFYVVNSNPQMSLSFKGLNGLDLTKPVNGRIEFEISANSSPIPMSSLDFHIKNLATGQENIRHVSIVMNKMTAGWRTNMGTNGAYELWMVGKVAAQGGKEFTTESNHFTVQVKN